MIPISERVSLKAFNTFGIDVYADFFCTVRSVQEFVALIQTVTYRQQRSLILGGGSNVLFLDDFKGLVIKNEIKGIEILHETDDYIFVRVGAGEVWHEFVMYCMQHNWGGIENLSLIPGTVGAAPMQNIGAYGVEVKDVIDNVDAVDVRTGEVRTFSNAECQFGYRESVFKGTLKEKFFISSVTLRLRKKNHQLHTSYGAIREVLASKKISSPTIQNISEAVIEIRSGKLPDPTKVGNAGSFFKNPVVTPDQFNELKKTYPTIPGYVSENQEVKVPAGWLIEQCGWKGKRKGDAGVHTHQALVLVNHGSAKGAEIFSLANEVKKSVKMKFNIELSTEVNIIS
ncbi:MAG: UDP-N-acetylmuramate dehydrogenase [Bacteroidota bacterium]